jgi:DNA polymerase III subunit delta
MSSLPKGTEKMIITFTGSNNFLLKAEVDRLVADFVEEQGDLALERVDGEEAEMNRISEALTSLPFLATKKLVVLRSPSAQKQFAEKIEQILKDVPETTDVLIVEPKLDKRSVYYKTLKKLTDFKEYNELDENSMAIWLVKEAEAAGGKLSRGDAQYLAQRVGLNQQLLASELHKLMHYNPEITRQTIDLLVEPTPQSTVFELLDAALAGKTKRAMELYEEQRRMKVEPQAILAMMAWQMHVLAIISTAGQKDPNEIASDARLNPYVVRKSEGVARRLGPARVKQLVADLLQLDINLKSKSIDADEALKNFLLNLSI